MRLPSSSADAALLSTLLFPLLVSAAGNIDCQHVRVDKTSFDLRKLGGPQAVMHGVDNGSGESFKNTTYTIDICKPLKWKSGTKATEKCPNGSRVCAIERFIKDDINTIEAAFPVAGELKGAGGRDLDAKWELLKKSKSNSDSEKEGLSLEINGGFKLLDGRAKKQQRAIVELLCDPNREGTENNFDPANDNYDSKAKAEEKSKREEEKDGEGDGEGEGDGGEDDGEKEDDGPDSASLQFVRYDTSGADADVLRLKWRTKYACEGSKDEQDAERNSHWGFFTWFVLIAFLSTATYLIFGSWLNYNRYGARGWDLLPHGDTIRDTPYLLKDWIRRVMNAVQGGGSRGGYAAV